MNLEIDTNINTKVDQKLLNDCNNNRKQLYNSKTNIENDEVYMINWLRIALSKNIGPRTFKTIMEVFKNNPADAIIELPEMAKKNTIRKKFEISSTHYVENFLENCKKFNARPIMYYQKDYPKLLRQIDDAPPFIIARGRYELLKNKKIGIVGARDASTNGTLIATKIAKELGESQFVIVSGLARGIDKAAHIGALSSGTIAVVAGGIDNIYPRENHKLYEKLYEEGLVISEKPIGAVPSAENFPQRNRIISGLSIGIIIIEASRKSGTLITANFAAEQGREVFAVPGSPLDYRYEGANLLIQDGAILIQNSEDVIRNLYWLHNDEERFSTYLEDSAKQTKYIAQTKNHINDHENHENNTQKQNMTEYYKDIINSIKKDLNHQSSIKNDKILQQYYNVDAYHTNCDENNTKFIYNQKQKSFYHHDHMKDDTKISKSELISRTKISILAKLSYNPISLKDIMHELCDIPSDIMNIAILELEISGQIERKLGNTIMLI